MTQILGTTGSEESGIAPPFQGGGLRLPALKQWRKELVELLVAEISAERDEDDRVRVNVTCRFGPPPEEVFVSSVRDSCGNCIDVTNLLRLPVTATR